MEFHTARQAWHDAYAFNDRSADVTQVRVDFGLKDNDWRIVEGIEAGKIQDAVNRLDPLLKAWGMLAYSHRRVQEDYDRVIDTVHQAYGLLYPGDFVQLGFRRNVRLLLLMEMALEDKIYNERNGGKKHKVADLARGIGVNPSNWSRDWGIVYERIQRIMDSWPAKSLGKLWPVIHEMQDKRELEREAKYAVI